MLQRFALLLPLLLVSREASACSGPCASPEVWQVNVAEGRVVVTTNFAILTLNDESWTVTCEEAIGGLLLGVEVDHEGVYATTADGLFFEQEPACGYELAWVPTEPGWLIDFTLAKQPGAERAQRFALVEDPNQSRRVLTASDGEEFRTVATFEPGSGYLRIVSGGTPAAVFATGYTFGPRTWHIAQSLDGGEEWTTSEPEFRDEVTLEALGVDPHEPEHLFIDAKTPSNEPADLLMFDAKSQEMRSLLTLRDAEAISGLAFTETAVYVAGRGGDRGTLYRASRSLLEFEAFETNTPPFSCLSVAGNRLFTCLSDFTRSSPFLVARSNDEGKSWQPLLTVSDLSKTESCGESCTETSDWLRATFGSLGTSPDAGASDASTNDKPAEREAQTGCAVLSTRRARLGRPIPLGWFGLTSLGLLLVRFRRRLRGRRAVARSRAVLRRDPDRSAEDLHDRRSNSASRRGREAQPDSLRRPR